HTHTDTHSHTDTHTHTHTQDCMLNLTPDFMEGRVDIVASYQSAGANRGGKALRIHIVFSPLAQAEDQPAYLMHSYFPQFKGKHGPGGIPSSRERDCTCVCVCVCVFVCVCVCVC